jgi:uncharacterized protein YndB with AHSA1/START domain
LSLNACPYRATSVFHRRPRVYWFYRGDNYPDARGFGQETTVTVTFAEQGSNTLMTLVHTGLTDTEKGRSHNGGWNFFLDKLRDQFAPASAKV